MIRIIPMLCLAAIAATSPALATAQNYPSRPIRLMVPYGAGSIGDRVFEDIANDGAFNGSDAGISGVTVRLYEDTNGNGVFDQGDVSVLTNSQGNYSFNSLAAGTYSIRLVAAKGYKVTSPSGGTHVATVVAGQISSGKNFVVVKA